MTNNILPQGPEPAQPSRVTGVHRDPTIEVSPNLHHDPVRDPLRPNPEADTSTDLREQLYNDGHVGPITTVSTPAAMITQLRGIMFDLDVRIFRTSSLLPDVPRDPTEFYRAVASRWLERHPVLRRAEVRNSGRGLHVLLWFKEPVQLESDADRERWTGIVQVVQVVLPIDPDQPHITAMTRPIGAINSKSGSAVTCLKQGEPVSVEDVLALHDEVLAAPFRTIMKILLGQERLSPCPCCNKPGSELAALDSGGQCYGHCGDVPLWRLFDLLLVERGAEVAEDSRNDPTTC